MLTEQGRVIALERGAVWVETVRKSTCGSCSAKPGCGHSVLAELTSKAGVIRVRDTASVRADTLSVGQQVEIAIPEAVILRGSLMVYLLPLVLGLMGALFLSNVVQASSDLPAIVGFIFGLTLGFATVRVVPRWFGWEAQMEPSLARVVSPESLIAASRS